MPKTTKAKKKVTKAKTKVVSKPKKAAAKAPIKISKTYIPKDNEKYMCEKHKVFFKNKLLAWKKDLVRSNNEALYNSSIDDNSTSADIVDQASYYTHKNDEMTPINRQKKLISKIQSAMQTSLRTMHSFLPYHTLQMFHITDCTLNMCLLSTTMKD